jgi:hypothetical protein
MSWVKVDGDMTIAEAMDLVRKGRGILKIRKVVRRGEKPIEFWMWVE